MQQFELTREDNLIPLQDFVNLVCSTNFNPEQTKPCIIIQSTIS